MTSRLRIEALRLRVNTANGAVGRDLRFADGLNLLRADNTAGKSTAMQAIIYALGLEGMLSASHRIPLAHAMTDRVMIDGVDSKVTSSSVALQIRNASGEVITVRRGVVSDQDNRLIVVERGPSLSTNGSFGRESYYVRSGGAAVNQAGFHRFLAAFVGLELPRVTKIDGSESPLYLETLFPYFYVEQKHGWSGIQARIPNYLGIRDVGKRSAEFVLGLDVFKRILDQQRVRSNLAALEADWHAIGKVLDTQAKSARVILQKPHGRIHQGWSDQSDTPVVSIKGQWIEIDDAIQHFTEHLKQLKSRDLPLVRDVSHQVEEKLQAAEAALQRDVARSAGLWDERNETQARLGQISLRIEALEEDLQRHKDSEKLSTYGAEHAAQLISEHICPTCHQEFGDGADISTHAMSVADNISFLKRQLATFESMKLDNARVLRALDVRLDGLSQSAHEYRQEIRAAKDTLASSNGSPSASAVLARLQIEERLEVLIERREELASSRAELSTIASTWAAQKKLLAGLASSSLSPEDTARLSRIQSSIQTQLTSYGFTSLEPDDVEIDRETYRPVNDGFDLGFDVSASDMIRVIWAYLFAMLEVGLSDGAHLGLLVFDEPRQQETARPSYAALLQQAARAGRAGAQIIFATSEESSSLRSMLDPGTYSMQDLAPGEKMLLPVSDLEPS
ncbi:hypothetical protein SRABI02_01420 [Plantibacter cousiniae]|nr:hypothetical protein SRABI02_01420 [Plantibacter cousiniae]